MKNKQNPLSEYEPDYVVEPMETLKELAIYHLFGKKLVKEFEQGITERNAYLLEAMFSMPRQFFLNLQKNYDKDKQRIANEEANP